MCKTTHTCNIYTYIYTYIPIYYIHMYTTMLQSFI